MTHPNAITPEMFAYYVGRPYEQDDLERCNCPIRGIGHDSCGWDKDNHSPMFMSAGVRGHEDKLFPANTAITYVDPMDKTVIGGYLKSPLLESQLKEFLCKAFEEIPPRLRLGRFCMETVMRKIKNHLIKIDAFKVARDEIPEGCEDVKLSLMDYVTVVTLPRSQK